MDVLLRRVATPDGDHGRVVVRTSDGEHAVVAVQMAAADVVQDCAGEPVPSGLAAASSQLRERGRGRLVSRPIEARVPDEWQSSSG